MKQAKRIKRNLSNHRFTVGGFSFLIRDKRIAFVNALGGSIWISPVAGEFFTFLPRSHRGKRFVSSKGDYHKAAEAWLKGWEVPSPPKFTSLADLF